MEATDDIEVSGHASVGGRGDEKFGVASLYKKSKFRRISECRSPGMVCTDLSLWIRLTCGSYDYKTP